jgi:hypothetical protein
MYQHKLIRFNYTTYDIRRAQDVVNPRTSHCNVMVLANDDDEAGSDQPEWRKFWYCRVLGIFHVNAVYIGPGMTGYTPQRLDFLWVRWYQSHCRGSDRSGSKSGWDTLKLHQLSFPPMSSDDAFGFLDPADVIRSCHLIPAFSQGRRYKGQTQHAGLSKCASDSDDWMAYYVGRYAFQQ